MLSELFEFLREAGDLQHQPVLRRRHRLLAPLPLPKPMTEAEVIAFFKVIDSLRDRAMFLLMLRCGLRVSEVSQLRWEDVDFDAGTLRINNSKGQIDRLAYLSPDLAATLLQWTASRKTSPFLFPAQRDPRRSHSARHIYRLMVDYLSAAGIGNHYSPHCLRHYAESLIMPSRAIVILWPRRFHGGSRDPARFFLGIIRGSLERRGACPALDSGTVLSPGAKSS